MADDHTFRNWAGRGLAAAAICAGLSLAPLPALAEGDAAVAPEATPAAAATAEAAPAAVTEAAHAEPAPTPAPAAEAPAEPAPVATTQASATPAEELKSAKSAQATAQDAATNAQNDVSQKTALKNAADKNVSEAQNAQANATQSEQRKDAAAAEAEQKDASAKDAEDEASQAKDVSDAELQAAKDAEDKATHDLISRQLAEAADYKKAENAKAEKEAADKAVSTAKSDLQTKQQNADSAQKTYDEANKALSDAKSAAAASQQAEIDRTKKALDDANKALAEAAANKESAATAYQQAQKSVDDAKSALATLQAELRQAQLDYTIAQRRETALKNISEGKTGSTIIINDGDKITRSDQLAIDQAQAESYMYNCRDDVERAKKNLTAAQATLDEAKKALEIAKQPISVDVSQGSLGFFKWLTSLDADNQDAIDVLTDSSITGTDIKTNKPFINMTHIGAKDDSTSLENVKRALEYIKQCNDIRAKDPENPGLKALKINTFLMGLAEVNANWTMSNSLTATGAHAIFSGENSYAGENAAGSYHMPWYDPFDAWYTGERIDFLNHTPNAQTGHYKAIVNAKNEETGFGVNTNTFGVDPLDQRFIQEFCSSSNSTRGVTYTYNEFMALFNAYYAAATKSSNSTTTARMVKVIEDRLAVAQKGVDDAETELAIRNDYYKYAQQDFKDARQAVLDNVKGKKGVKTAKERATEQLSAAHQKTVAAQSKVSSCQSKVTAAQKTLDAANKTLATAKSQKDNADSSYQKQASLVKVAQDAYDIAKSGTNDARVQQAQQRVTTAQKNLTAAKQAAAAAQTTYDRAVSRASAAEKNLQTAEGDLANAQAASKKAKQDYDAAYWAYVKVAEVRRHKNELVAYAKKARADATAAKEAYETAVEQWETATARAKEAQAHLGDYQKAASDAAAALRDSQARLATAQSDLAAANDHLAAAQAAWKRATATVELYRLFDPHSGEHLYTTHREEVDHLQGQGWDWETAQTMLLPKSGVPVWRLFDPSKGDHHYTTDAWEAKVLTTQKGWVYDFGGAPAFFGAKSGRPVYRINNTHATRFAHLFTADTNERNVHLREGGWENENIAWYAVDPATLKAPAAPKSTVARKAFYAIRYDGNGGAGTMAAQAAAVGASAQLRGNAFWRSGYTFAGWSRMATGGVAYANWATVRDLATKDGSVVALFAVWDPVAKTYTVRYSGNGATGGSTAGQTMTRGKTSLLAQNGYSRTGYTFQSWNTRETGTGTSYSQGQSVSNLAAADGSITLYAIWKPITYYVEFSGNNATSGSMVKQAFTYDQAQNLAANGYSKTGYHFASWKNAATGSAYSNGASVKNLSATKNGTVTLGAQWSPNTYTVRYVANGGSGSMADQAFTYDQAKNLLSSEYKRTGYWCIGWATSSNGSKAYELESSVKNLTPNQGGTIYGSSVVSVGEIPA